MWSPPVKCLTLDTETWSRIEEANKAAGWPNDWTVAERDQMEALAENLNRELLALHARHKHGPLRIAANCSLKTAPTKRRDGVLVAEILRVAEQDGLAVWIMASVWHPPKTVGIMFYPKTLDS
jgi:hypothetical protein